MHTCRHCKGSGRVLCPRCEGTGVLNKKETCYYCQGERMVTCPACNGKGEVED